MIVVQPWCLTAQEVGMVACGLGHLHGNAEDSGKLRQLVCPSEVMFS